MRSVGVSPTSVAWTVVSKHRTDRIVRATLCGLEACAPDGRRRDAVVPHLPCFWGHIRQEKSPARGS
ncbi:MAG: hypothetical protein NZ874_05450 [Fimbriimonadales bacterium]|nr:hypothetical protein [Fimbriimonadales bacterium]